VVDVKAFEIGEGGVVDFSNVGPSAPPSREKMQEALERWRALLSEASRFVVDPTVTMSAEMFDEGLRDGWLEVVDGLPVFRAVAGLPDFLLPYARPK
jgi:hypothetical protein